MEICVFDREKLIAISYFDLGQSSMASLLAVYDEEYSQYSLGTYTMIKEMEYGQMTQRSWYYPGYVLDQPSAFDYKLRLGHMEYYTSGKRWGKFENFQPTTTVAHRLRFSMKQLLSRLQSECIPHKTWYYPYFSMGYMPLWKDRFLHLPHVVELGHDLDGTLMVGYCSDSKDYVLTHVHPCPDEQHFINMEQAREFGNSDTYLSHLMEYGDGLCRGSIEDILEGIAMWQQRPDKLPPV